jgi:general stress protein 26
MDNNCREPTRAGACFAFDPAARLGDSWRLEIVNRKEFFMAEDQIGKIRQMLEALDSAMLITHAPDQPLHARPMAIARVEPNCDLWFFSGRASTKVHEIQSDQKVLVACQDDRRSHLSLSGRAELVSDPAKARELWKESYKTWFPQGVDDPNLLLILVHAQQAEYWDSQGASGIKHVFESGQSGSSGSNPEPGQGEPPARVAL